jgi:dTDP-4-dehydrorhamnose reductase
MKVLVTGANGQLGTDLGIALHDFEVIPLAHHDIEITDLNAVQAICHRHRPDAIINTAAYVRVDDCEKNADKAFLVNALAARNMAVIAQGLGAKLIHISTDYVFGGDNDARTIPYTEFDTPDPREPRSPSMRQALHNQDFESFWSRR